ncbi:MAG TPA: DEAD/DEAH box helicase family protein [Fimbriimonadaceae bacterium]|nr:DEAD/DEAH box helicase family protein [Fimbriimonadaceae bacterium]
MNDLFDAKQQARDAGASLIDEPIINGPFDEPARHWKIVDLDKAEQQTPHIVDTRRDAGYFIKPKGAQSGGLLHEVFVPLDHVNEIRRRVKAWRDDGYRGVTPVTRKLLDHWNAAPPERENRMFFCQREAVETIIWLHESHPADRQGLMVEVEDETGATVKVPLEQAHEAFLRYCTKMATGTGKTIVMGMLITWSVLNKLSYPQATWCSDAVLIVAPGVTVKERLGVLIPGSDGNYYDHFNLVPPSLRSRLGEARICLVHRQEMAVKDDTRTKSVQKLGRESDSAFSNRLLKRDLGSRGRILVLNDEGHHCYKPRQKPNDQEAMPLDKESKDENERAAQWITGLEKIHAARGILTCLDLSATPFYINSSGYPEGRPFPWIVSDFGLVDAIESGLVKIPQMPVDDNHGDGKRPPAYFHLWQWINEGLPSQDRETARRKAKPEAVVSAAEPALVTMIGNWKKEFDQWQESGNRVPPCLIVVTADTQLSQLIHERMTREDFEFKDFVNHPGRPPVTFLYDSKELKNAEEGERAKDAELRKRAIMNSVGKEGQPGEQVRCIVSVSMLTEGWDANNVTHIVGLRGFTSQLLCEQVVGRALRRVRYDQLDERGFLLPEYADVYGVPFQVIPVKAKAKGSVNPPMFSTLVQALKERSAEHEILFPRVEGYVSAVQDSVVCDWEKVPCLLVGKSGEPTFVDVKAAVGLRVGRPDRSGPGTIERHDRIPYYIVSRAQSASFRIASQLAQIRVPGRTDADVQRRHRLFPQFLEIVRKYVGDFITFEEAPTEEIGLQKWQDKILNVLSEHIHASDSEGEPLILPRIERFRPEGSTREIFFRTGRPCRETNKSHISHVVLDSPTWENTAAYQLEKSPHVQSYARNENLDFTIPYVDSQGAPRTHRPDFIVRLTNGKLVALEVKGHERELDQIKKKAGLKWAAAVNQYYGEQRWAYDVTYQPDKLDDLLAKHLQQDRPII